MTGYLPRIIAPELVREGDTISVRFPEDGGITITKQGIVHRITAEGSLRSLRAIGGTPLAVYAPGIPILREASRLVITLLARPEHPQTELAGFDMDRIYGDG